MKASEAWFVFKQRYGLHVDRSQFGFEYHDATHFTRSQWGKERDEQQLGSEYGAVSPFFLGYRLVVFLFVLINFLTNLGLDIHPGYYFIYLTSQGVLILSINEAVQFALVVVSFVKYRRKQGIVGLVTQENGRRSSVYGSTSGLVSSAPSVTNLSSSLRSPSDMTAFHKLAWAACSLSSSLAVFITIFYWAALYSGPGVSYWNVFVHALNSVVSVIDLFVTLRPYRWHHFYVPFTYGLGYLVFTLIYYYAGGTDAEGNEWIYPVVDWSKPGPTVGVVFGAALLLFASHALLFALFKFRVFIYEDLLIPGHSRYNDSNFPFWIQHTQSRDFTVNKNNTVKHNITSNNNSSSRIPSIYEQTVIDDVKITRV